MVGEAVATAAGRLVGSGTQPLIVPRSMSEAGCVEYPQLMVLTDPVGARSGAVVPSQRQ